MAVDGILIAMMIFQGIDVLWIAACRSNFVPSLQFFTEIIGTGAICFDIARIHDRFWVRPPICSTSPLSAFLPRRCLI